MIFDFLTTNHTTIFRKPALARHKPAASGRTRGDKPFLSRAELRAEVIGMVG